MDLLRRRGDTTGITQMADGVVCMKSSAQIYKRGEWQKNRYRGCGGVQRQRLNEIRRIYLKRYQSA